MPPDIVVLAVVVVVGVIDPSPTYKSKFGDPTPALPTTPCVAWATSCAETAAGDKDGSLSNNRAAAPATCGAAMDVPLSSLEAVSLETPAERMPTPGAKTSRHCP